MQTRATNEEMSERITRYYLMHRSVLKSLMKVGKMPLAQYHILSLLAENNSMLHGGDLPAHGHLPSQPDSPCG